MAELPPPSELLPHRGRYLLIDRITRLDETGVEGVALFTVESVQGHFPGQPVVPGVLLLEAMAQTLAVAHLAATPGGGTPFLAGFDKVRFRAPVIPPAQVDIQVRFGEERFGVRMATAVARVGGKRVCTATLLGAVMPTEPEAK